MKIKFLLEITVEAETELKALENMVDLIKTDAYRATKSVLDIHLSECERLLEVIPNDDRSGFEKRIEAIRGMELKEDNL